MNPLKEAAPWLGYGSDDLRRFYFEGRFSDRTWEALQLAIRWAAPRLSSDEQERFYERHGRRAYYRKIDRVRKAFGVAPLDPPGVTS